MRLKNFLLNVDMIHLLVKDVGKFQMEFDRNTYEWYIDLKTLDLPKRHFEYLFVVDNRFFIHHPKVLYREYSEDVFMCVYNETDLTDNDDIPEIRALGYLNF